MPIAPRIMRPTFAAPKFQTLGYTRLWGLTNKNGAVGGTVSSDAGRFAVRWWDQSVDVYLSGQSFSKSGTGIRAFDVYPVIDLVLDDSGNSLDGRLYNDVFISSSQTPFYGASAYFGQYSMGYIRTSASSALAVGTANFTLEAWAYPTGKNLESDLSMVVDTRLAGGGTGLCIWYDSSTSKWVGYASAVGGVQYSISSTANATENAWTHLAFVRNGTSLSFYVDGALQGSTTIPSSRSFSVASPWVYCGTAADTPGEWRTFRGYIDDVRFVKSAVYTSAFTRPSTALAAVTNTLLLLHLDSISEHRPSGRFTGFDVRDNSITSLRAENLSLSREPGWYNYTNYSYVLGNAETGFLQNNSLSAAALDQFYTDLLAGSGDLFVNGNPGIVADTPTIATAKGYAVFGSTP